MAQQQFRETMWFKLGNESQEQQQEHDGDEGQPSATVMNLPIEDRYTGEVTSEDSRVFGLHTGKTEAIRLDKALATVELDGDVAMKTLVREMKKQSRKWIAGACVAIAAVASTLLVYV